MQIFDAGKNLRKNCNKAKTQKKYTRFLFHVMHGLKPEFWLLSINKLNSTNNFKFLYSCSVDGWDYCNPENVRRVVLTGENLAHSYYYIHKLFKNIYIQNLNLNLIFIRNATYSVRICIFDFITTWFIKELKCKLFADDTSFYLPGKTLVELINISRYIFRQIS
ncbi:hypothetical protein BpHYR1_027061 [Brachionus plicatilis]|uniref:Uncharacterized protein n=1 Tax=Brachionus plicatilis TaxID=10195 RepID=A0A3M7SFL9_BRAPC|nr:hypothetical protein BpHYR1_027061 [Brachionus plicatilis]